MFLLPPGTLAFGSLDWLAYADTPGYRSYYNDKWGASTSGNKLSTQI